MLRLAGQNFKFAEFYVIHVALFYSFTHIDKTVRLVWTQMPRTVRAGTGLIRSLNPNAERIGNIAVFTFVKRELEAHVVRAGGPTEFEYCRMSRRGSLIRKGVAAVDIVIGFGERIAVFPKICIGDYVIIGIGGLLCAARFRVKC